MLIPCPYRVERCACVCLFRPSVWVAKTGGWAALYSRHVMSSGPDVDSYREDKSNWTGGGLNVEPPEGPN